MNDTSVIYIDDHYAFCNESRGMEESQTWPLCKVALIYLADLNQSYVMCRITTVSAK